MFRLVPAALSAEEIRDVNARYHDVAAHDYDSKWGIDFGAVGREQVLAKVTRALGHEPGRYERALEIGAGTGYFSLNLLRSGVIGRATCSDISAASTVAPIWRRAIGARAARGHEREAHDSALESFVDVHAFAPGELARAARESGLEDVRVSGEELFANWFGWANRTLEATAEPGDVPWAWRQYAYRGYLLLQDLDRRLLEGRLPAALFYNLMLSARRSAEAH